MNVKTTAAGLVPAVPWAKMYLSHSAITCYRRWPAEYKAKYIDRLSPERASMNLGYGKAVDEGFSAFVAGHALGTTVDPVPLFVAAYEEFARDNDVEYTSRWDGKDAAIASGRVLLERLVEKWHSLGWTAALDPDARPLVQLELKVVMPNNVIYTSIIDFVVMTEDGRLLVVDLKTPSAESTAEFARLSDQLTGYQLAVETHHKTLGIDHIDGLAFLDAIKKPIPKTSRGSGPVVAHPHIVEPRTREQLQAFVDGVLWTAEDIRRGRFPMHSLDSYNSPCNMSEYVNYILTGDTTGLVVRPKRHRKRKDPTQIAMEGV